MTTQLAPALDLECRECHTRFETDLMEAAQAEHLVCPSCGAVGDSAAELELLKSLSRVPELSSSPRARFAFNALHLTEKPRLPRVEARSSDEEPTAIGWAQLRYETAVEAAREGRWQAAFKAALDAQEQVDDAARMIASAYCPQCQQRRAAPAAGSPAIAKARYSRGKCPKCDAVLRVRA